MSVSPFPRRTSSGRGHLLLQGQVSHSSRLVGPRWHVLCLPPILLSDARSNVRVSFLFILKFIFFLHSVPLCCLLASVKCILSITPPPYQPPIFSLRHSPVSTSVSSVLLNLCIHGESRAAAERKCDVCLSETELADYDVTVCAHFLSKGLTLFFCAAEEIPLCFCSTLSIPPLWVPCVGSDLAVVCSAAVKSHTRVPVLLIWSLPRKCSGVWFQDLRSLCTDFISVWVCPRPTNTG